MPSRTETPLPTEQATVRRPLRLLGWCLFWHLLLAQVYLLYLSTGSGEPYFPYDDKVAHLLIFGVPAGLAALLGRPWAVGLVVAHALLSEPLQAWLTASRVADPWDLVADLVGIVLGVVVAAVLLRRTRRSTALDPAEAERALRGDG